MGYIDYRICLGHIYKFKKILFINQFQSVIFCITLIETVIFSTFANTTKRVHQLAFYHSYAISQSKIYLHRTRPKAIGSLPRILNTLIIINGIWADLIRILLIYTKNKNHIQTGKLGRWYNNWDIIILCSLTKPHYYIEISLFR